MECFDTRRGRFQTQSRSVSTSDVAVALPQLLEKLLVFPRDDRYKEDEFGLQFPLSPYTTIAMAQLSGSKKR